MNCEIKLLTKVERFLEDIKSVDRSLSEMISNSPEEKIYLDAFKRNSDKFKVNTLAIIEMLRQKAKNK